MIFIEVLWTRPDKIDGSKWFLVRHNLAVKLDDWDFENINEQVWVPEQRYFIVTMCRCYQNSNRTEWCYPPLNLFYYVSVKKIPGFFPRQMCEKCSIWWVRSDQPMRGLGKAKVMSWNRWAEEKVREEMVIPTGQKTYTGLQYLQRWCWH